MPTLDWIGKKSVVNHHREVAYRLLHCDKSKSVGDPDAGNLLVQGDNLEALKALLPYYAGRVKCIYIDPPYNTGNEGWIYNDNVNSPEMREWLGKAVGKEAEDLSRHDKWLCMMYPRLRLLKDFLSQDGAIFVSIDDNEVFGLQALLNEVFGRQNRIETFIWKKSYGGGAKEKFAITQHEYVFMYAKDIDTVDSLWLPPRDDIRERYYKYEDKFVKERGPYRIKPLEATKSMDRRENLVYAIPSPNGEEIFPERQWWWSRERTMQALKEGRLVFTENKGKKSVSYKQYLFDENGDERLSKPFSVIDKIYTQQGTADIRAIFDGNLAFNFPKPVQLISDFIQIMTMKDTAAIVMDSFGGSGTTAQATLELNAQDGGMRRFVLVEIDYQICHEITSKRIRRVVEGYRKNGDSKLPIDGLGSGFRFCTLGTPLFDAEGSVNPEVTFPDLAAHVFFCETGSPIPKRASDANPLIGTFNGRAVYLLHAAESVGVASARAGNVLTAAKLAKLSLPEPGFTGPRVVYAEGCTVPDDRLNALGVTFKQIPYQIEGL